MAVHSRVTTALGRVVPLDEWGTVQSDLVLKVLHDYRMSPFNPNNLWITTIQLANASRIAPNEAEAIAEALVAEALVERLPGESEPSFRITGKGVILVRNLQGSAGVY